MERSGGLEGASCRPAHGGIPAEGQASGSLDDAADPRTGLSVSADFSFYPLPNENPLCIIYVSNRSRARCVPFLKCPNGTRPLSSGSIFSRVKNASRRVPV